MVDTTQWDGGIPKLPAAMSRLVDRAGLLSSDGGGQELRNLFEQVSMRFDPTRLSPFGAACFMGLLERVQKLAPSFDPKATETAFKWSYIQLCICGAQQIAQSPTKPRHAEVIRLLLSLGASADAADVLGQTPIMHICMTGSDMNLLRLLCSEGSANVRARDKFGRTAIHVCMLLGKAEAVDTLLEFGADPDVPDADGTLVTAEIHGPKVTSIIERWKRKKTGQEGLLEEKACDGCGKRGVKLLNCAGCRLARYCSTECQKTRWPTHKAICRKVESSEPLSVRPRFDHFKTSFSTSEVIRNSVTGGGKAPGSFTSTPGHLDVARLKNQIVKVQVPLTSMALGNSSAMACMVYNKRRSLWCTIHREDGIKAYDALVKAVRDKGVGGAKAYFRADLKSPTELVIQTVEALAAQPW